MNRGDDELLEVDGVVDAAAPALAEPATLTAPAPARPPLPAVARAAAVATVGFAAGAATAAALQALRGRGALAAPGQRPALPRARGPEPRVLHVHLFVHDARQR